MGTDSKKLPMFFRGILQKKKTRASAALGGVFVGMLIFSIIPFFAQGEQGAGDGQLDLTEEYYQTCRYLDDLAREEGSVRIGGIAYNALLESVSQHDPRTFPCGVVKLKDGQIVGYSWVQSPIHTGWICWGKTCTGDDFTEHQKNKNGMSDQQIRDWKARCGVWRAQIADKEKRNESDEELRTLLKQFADDRCTWGDLNWGDNVDPSDPKRFDDDLKTLHHREPDASGSWFNDRCAVTEAAKKQEAGAWKTPDGSPYEGGQAWVDEKNLNGKNEGITTDEPFGKPKVYGCAMFLAKKYDGHRLIRLHGTIPLAGNRPWQQPTYDADRKEFSGWAYNNTFWWIGFSGKTRYDTYLRPPCRSGTQVCVKKGISAAEKQNLDNYQCLQTCSDGGTDPMGDPIFEPLADSCKANYTPLFGSGWFGWCRGGTSCVNNSGAAQNSSLDLNVNYCSAKGSNEPIPYIPLLSEGRSCEPFCDEDVADIGSGNEQSLWRTAYVGAQVKVVGGSAAATRGGSKTGIDQEKGFQDYLIMTARHGEDEDAPSDARRRFPFTEGEGNTETYLKRIPDGGVADPVAFKNKLGTLDVRALTDTTPVKTVEVKTKTSIGDITYNREVNTYGLAVKKFSSDSQTVEEKLFNHLTSRIDDSVQETVFYTDENVAIGKTLSVASEEPVSWQISNAPKGYSGARTVVIRGDVEIRAPLFYEPIYGGVEDFKQIASVAFIVLKRPDGTGGNITFYDCIPPYGTNARPSDPYFTQADGLYFAEGAIRSGRGKGSPGRQGCGAEFEKIVIGDSANPDTGFLPRLTEKWDEAYANESSALFIDAAGDDECSLASDRQECEGAITLWNEAKDFAVPTRPGHKTVTVSSGGQQKNLYDAFCKDPRDQNGETSYANAAPPYRLSDWGGGSAADFDTYWRTRRPEWERWYACNRFVMQKQQAARERISAAYRTCAANSATKQQCEDAQEEIDSIGRLDLFARAYLDYYGTEKFSTHDLPLKNNGSMIAQEFKFERTFLGFDQGSETVENTGRHIVNPPPGLADIARRLPRFQ